jgi:hypothetical protein
MRLRTDERDRSILPRAMPRLSSLEESLLR